MKFSRIIKRCGLWPERLFKHLKQLVSDLRNCAGMCGQQALGCLLLLFAVKRNPSSPEKKFGEAVPIRARSESVMDVGQVQSSGQRVEKADYFPDGITARTLPDE